MEEPMKASPKHAVAEPDAQVKNGESKGTKGRFSKMKRWQKILIVIGICVVALIVIAGISLAVVLNVGKSELLDSGEGDQSYKTVEYQGKTYVYNEAMTSICIIGTDKIYGYVDEESSASADAILLLAYDTSSGKATLVNVPRNLKMSYTIDVPNVGPVVFPDNYLSAAYALYADNDAEASQQVCDAVSGLLNNIPINNYCSLLESAIGPLTEAMGGVTLTAIQDVPWVGVEKGETYTMTGEQALRYVQWRNIHVLTSPTDRMMRQRQFAEAFVDQTIETAKKDPTVLVDMYSIMTNPNYITTNIDSSELTYLVSTAMSNGFKELSLAQIPYDDYFNRDTSMSEYYVKGDELKQLLLDIYYKPVEG